jgi:hypothetical protein
MEKEYSCPKCDGTDVYFAKKQVITGVGGIYGNRAREERRPFCKVCDIEANWVNALDFAPSQVPVAIRRPWIWIVTGIFAFMAFFFDGNEFRTPW